MPEYARRYEDRYYYSRYETRYTGISVVNNQTTVRRRKPLKTKNNKKAGLNKFLSKLVTFSLLFLFGVLVLPIGFKNIMGSIFTKSPYPYIKANYESLTFPTVYYLNNNLFLGRLSLNSYALPKKALMSELNTANEMSDLESSIKNILPMFPTIHPAVFVWDYDTGNYADINGEEIFSTASIIKLPVLLQLFKSIEANQLSLYDRMVLTDYYRAEGSGSLQYKAENSAYTIDKLARLMITESDNSATNMLMSRIGSMTDVNQGIRDWGLKNTHINAWLPDLEGKNHSTAKDLARMLYNIENNKFLSETSSAKIIDYMSNVKNDRLIPAGLGEGASIIHKTGDIGSMLGDSGIVTTANGKKYIVVILANRPHNAPEGKDFIVKTSEIIYNYMLLN